MNPDDLAKRGTAHRRSGNPAKAAAGTIRKDFASSIEANAVHGSDSPESAAFEIPYFFSALEIFPR